MLGDAGVWYFPLRTAVTQTQPRMGWPVFLACTHYTYTMGGSGSDYIDLAYTPACVVSKYVPTHSIWTTIVVRLQMI